MELLTNLYLLLSFAMCRGQRSSCDRCDPRLACDCSHAGYTLVPTVTDRALTLDLSFNDIAVVTGGDLTGHEKLRILILHRNVDKGFILSYSKSILYLFYLISCPFCFLFVCLFTM